MNLLKNATSTSGYSTCSPTNNKITRLSDFPTSFSHVNINLQRLSKHNYFQSSTCNEIYLSNYSRLCQGSACGAGDHGLSSLDYRKVTDSTRFSKYLGILSHISYKSVAGGCFKTALLFCDSALLSFVYNFGMYARRKLLQTRQKINSQSSC